MYFCSVWNRWMSPLTRPCLYTSWRWSQHLTYQIVYIPHYDKHTVSYAQAGLGNALGSWMECRVAVHSSTCCSERQVSFFYKWEELWTFPVLKCRILLFLCHICYLRIIPLLIYTHTDTVSSDASFPELRLAYKSDRSHSDTISLSPQSRLIRFSVVYILQFPHCLSTSGWKMNTVCYIIGHSSLQGNRFDIFTGSFNIISLVFVKLEDAS